jgi:small GTP-binding protein
MLKILIIGDSGTGKTSLVNLYVYGKFNKVHKPTIVGTFQNKNYDYYGKQLKLTLWDIAGNYWFIGLTYSPFLGQDRLGGVSKLFWRDAVGAVVVCDVTRPETLENAILWKQQMEDYISGDPSMEKIPFVLAINKMDLVEDNEDRKTSQEYYNSFSKTNGFSAAIKTSAKENMNVDETFSALVESIVRDHSVTDPKSGKKQIILKDASKLEKRVRITLTEEDQPKKKRHCWG